MVGDPNFDWLTVRSNSGKSELNDYLNEFDFKQFENSPTKETSFFSTRSHIT